MRFRSFEFQHYAGFENRLLEFDPDKRLHIILGANEAGKSRLLRAFVRFLYGFPSRNDPDQFGTIRSKSKLLASVQIDGKFENFERNTTKTNGFSAAGSEVSVETLQAALGGVNEKQFLNLHALSHDELRDGGQELMSGQGNLGQSLFAAGAGLVPIQKKIAYHEAQAADLFRPRGTTKKINELIAKRVALQEQLKGVEFNQQKYAELSGKIHKAERARDNLAQLLAEKRAVLLTVQKTSELVLKRDFLTSKNTAALEQRELKALKLKDKCKELHLPEDWLMGDHVGFLEVVKQLSADLEDAARQLENSKSSLLEDQNVDEKVQSLDVSELVGLPDLDHLQKNLTSLENQLSEKKNEVLDLTRQLDLPSVDFGDVPASDEMRGLIEQARGTIQEERTLVKRIESVKSSLRDLESQKTRLSQEAPEIDEQQFQETIDQRDDCIRQAIILNAARKFEATAEKLTNVQALLSNLDKLSAKRLSKADDLAKLASLTNEINKAEAEISAIDQDLKGCETTKLNLKATWSEKWLNAGISQIDMRDYSRWQSLYETFLEKRKGVINLELGVSQSEANVVGARTIIASVFEKWSGPMGKKQGGYSTVEQYNMLNSWAGEVQDMQARSKSNKAMKSQVQRNEKTVVNAIAKLNSELDAAGLQGQPSAARLIAFVGKIESLLHLHSELELDSVKRSTDEEAINNLNIQLKNMGEDESQTDDIQTLQRDADQLRDDLSQAQQICDALEKEFQSKLTSNDPMFLQSQIRETEDLLLERAVSYKKHVAAAHVLKSGMDRFVASQGKGILEKASAHIHALTNGRYQEIRVDGIEDESEWHLVDMAGVEVPAAGLSDGTRDQLFLAMRLAFLSNSTLPFISDDLFINFDDDRSESAFKRLNAALPENQLFYFTHHHHLASVAEAALGTQNVEIIQLA